MNSSFVLFDDIADPQAAVPNFNLVNRASLDKIFKAEIFVHIDGQLRAAHLILDYIPISKSLLASKCAIKARDPRLQRISVAAPGFLLSSPILEGTHVADPIPEGIPKVASPPSRATGVATSSHLASTEEEEVVDVPDSEDEFEVFNRAWSLETSTFDLGPPFSPLIDEKGIQRKQRSSLKDLLESLSRKDAPRKVAPALPLQLEPAGLKRMREPKGKEMMDTGKTHPS